MPGSGLQHKAHRALLLRVLDALLQAAVPVTQTGAQYLQTPPLSNNELARRVYSTQTRPGGSSTTVQNAREELVEIGLITPITGGWGTLGYWVGRTPDR